MLTYQFEHASEIEEEVKEQEDLVSEVPVRYKSSSMPNVLVVNDEPMQLMAQKRMFEQVKFKVSTATNGFEAFNAVKQSIDCEVLYDLVVLDLQMPVMNGTDACTKINNLYTDPNKMFSDLQEISIYDYEKGTMCVKKFEPNSPLNILTKYLRPVMVAVSANEVGRLEGFDLEF